ncbi:hypothetical protein PV08_08152 [Exophiala spinifera]|uniref:Uncharacterized protein n=1 Tax=Exophiala spinifera TaxID=91928 RepID=A0A0D2B2Y0_9EURO|nr:uncharacterized protein PV08_08152 [Exophiala spinifera]KIW12965.1 hypothetical protein PV08_08152 [Exophiala spinifera]
MPFAAFRWLDRRKQSLSSETTEEGCRVLAERGVPRSNEHSESEEDSEGRLASSKGDALPLEVIEPGTWTLRVCILGLATMWLTGLATIIYGSIVEASSKGTFQHWGPSFIHKRAIGPLTQLAIAFWITLLTDIAGLVHSTSLRFSLLARRKLTFNSNLRLFTSCPDSPVHSWPINIIWAWSLISSYACGSMVIVESVYDYSNSGEVGFHTYDIVSGYALIFLGFGLLGQALIASWALMVCKFPSWSTNPIKTAKICRDLGWLRPLTQRTMLSVHDAQSLEPHDSPSLPKVRQGSLLRAHSNVRPALIFVWVVTALSFLWFIAVTLAYQLGGSSIGPSWGTFSRSYTNDWSLIPDWHDVTAFIAISTSLGQSSYTFGPWFLCKYLLTCVFLGGITMDLHVVELLVQCSRDESLWRQTASARGLDRNRDGALEIAFRSWETIALFVFKTAVNWVFSMAFGPYWEGIEMRIPQICYTAISLFWLSLLATYLALWKPKGPQPATFGHLPTLVDLIDVWPGRGSNERSENAVDGGAKADHLPLFWGDKGTRDNGFRRAGTDHAPLQPIVMTALYL